MNIYHTRQLLKSQSIYDVDMRVSYYARVSTEKEEQKNSIKNQKKHFEDLIASNHHWTFAGGYVDEGISGMRTEKREEFQRMIRDAKTGKFDLIITKEISRFARNTLDSIQYTRELLSYGVCVWFQNDNINTVDDDSEFRLTIMAGVAQDEIRKLSSRVRFGHAQSIKNGVVLGNSHLYGYNKEKGRLTINEEEAIMVRDIFEKYASGWSSPKLEKYLYERGYRNYKGGKINRGVIQHIITNPKYKGWYAGGKVKIVDMFTKKQEFLPQEEWNLYKDDGSRVPAIVDEETWEEANRQFKIRSEAIKSHRTSFKDGNLFTGKIFCANDGSPYWMKQHYSRGKEDVRWVCSHRIKNGASSCSSFPVIESEIKMMLADIIKESAPQIDGIIEKYLCIYKRVLEERRIESKKTIEALNLRVQGIKAKSEKILDYNLSGAISDEEFVRRNAEYNEQINSIEEEIKELSRPQESSGEIQKQLSHVASLLKTYSEIGPDDINCQIVNNLINRILITPTGDKKAYVEFILNNYSNRQLVYHKSNRISRTAQDEALKAMKMRGSCDLGCSDNIFNIMYSEQLIAIPSDDPGHILRRKIYSEQHIVCYRQKIASKDKYTEINYTYSMAI